MDFFFTWDVNSQRKLNYNGSILLDPSVINVSKSYEHAKIEDQNLLYEIGLSKQFYKERMIYQSSIDQFYSQ